MKIQERTEGNVVIYDLKGKIMGGEPGSLLRGKVAEAMSSGKKDFVLNIKDIDWMNSIGLGLLVSLLKTIKEGDGRLRLANIENIEKVLIITKLVTTFDISDNVEDALAALA